MTKTKIKIQLGEYLSEVLPNGMMPSNVVINKHQCGLGITYSEIKAPRNSLIICPFTSLCEAKAAKHKADNLFAVVKGVTSDALEEYIITTLNHEGKYMKLITVPEDLYKVEKACHSLGIDIYSTFFVFIDECQHPVSDADWRKAILTPLNLFFNAAQKAMASATPLGMSDPRFEEQNFTLLDIEPEYSYRIDTELYTTNNVLQTMKYVMNEISESAIAERSYYIFCKSNRVSMGLIKSLGIEDCSSVFGSEEIVERTKREYKFKRAYSTFTPEKANRFNFLTFRFADGIDMENLGEKPIVMVVTDVYSSSISWVNPSVDPYQIHGRFREGVSKFVVISNHGSFPVVSRDAAEQMLGLHQNYYLHTKSLMQTENNPTLRNAYAEILNALPFAELVDEDGNPSSFLCDNHIESLVTKGCYNNHHTLAKAYELNSEKYNLQFIDQWWPIGDYEYLKLQSPAISGKEKRKLVVDYLKGLEPIDSEMKQQAVEELRQVDAETVEAYFKLGADKMAELKFNKKTMKEACIEKKYSDSIFSSPKFNELLNNSFPSNRFYSREYCKKELIRIHEVAGIVPPHKITGTMIKQYFYTKEQKQTVNGKQVQGFFLYERK